MRILTKEEFIKEGEPIYNSLFCSEDPLDNPFQDKIDTRLLLYEYYYELREPWLTAIKEIMMELGEDGFYKFISHRIETDEKKIPYYSFIYASEFKKEQIPFYPLGGVIFSKNGRWGIITSYNDFAIFGGEPWMKEIIEYHVKDMNQRLNNFLNYWKGYKQKRNAADLNWLPGLLEHIYGKNKMENLLMDNGLSWLLKTV